MFGFRRSAFETEGWVECGGGLPVPQECIDRSSVRCSNYPYPRCKNLWQARASDKWQESNTNIISRYDIIILTLYLCNWHFKYLGILHKHRGII
ncbi:hypothetical protein C5167_013023 [Papaver somniferum]|uniref:Uncharacterized protein n=1 Tax=Papaver somniferum TaxID=3469 RepID=A0A4Y7IZ53_PAPSO|nr:hypothetical protein C5167_013023 [Papaver somniferum]